MKILQKLGLAGLVALAGCTSPKYHEEKPTPAVNQVVELTPMERASSMYRDRFNKAYELAKSSYQTYMRNRDGTDPINRAVSESSLTAHTTYVKEMKGYIQALSELGIDTSGLEKQLQQWPK